MVFVGGLFLGVYGFAFTYPLWEKMYLANYLGEPKVSESLGMKDGLFGLLLILAALVMFAVAEWAEKKIPERRILKIEKDKYMKPLRLLALIIIPLGIILAAVPADKTKHFKLSADELLQEAGAGVQFISPDVIADMLVQKDPSLQLIDVRTPEEFEAYSLRGR